VVAVTTRIQGRVARAKWSWSARSKKDATILLILVGVVAVTWLPRLRGPIDLTWDGSVYYILGTSLAEGKGYRLLNEPGEIEAIQYPPLLPLIVAAHQRLLGTNDFLVVGQWLRIFYFLLTVSFIVAAYHLARLRLSPEYALAATLVCVLYFFVYYCADTLYADIPFGLATVLFVLCDRKAAKVAYGIAAGVLAIASYLLRTAGIALLVAWVAESLVRGRYRQMLLRAGIGLVPIVLWQAHIVRVRNSQQYNHPAYPYQRAAYQYSNVTYAENMSLIDPFKPELGGAGAVGMLLRVGRNLVGMPHALGQPVSAPASFWRAEVAGFFSLLHSKRAPPQLLVDALITVLGCLVIGGMVLLWTRQEWFIPLYCVAYVFITCMTPWPEQFPRYLMPLTPFLALSLFGVFAWVAEWRRKQERSWERKVVLVLTVLLLSMIFVVQVSTLTHAYVRGHRLVTYYDASGSVAKYPLFYHDWEAVNDAFEWLRRRGKPGEVISATAPHSAYLRTGLKAVLPPMESDSELAERLLDSVPVKYVVLDVLGIPGISERYAAPAIERHPQMWKPIYVAPGGAARIYERVQ
jgi:4-amino-4-deoxy-L-arabinose transferase-like glycosyltransferase